MLDVLGSRLGVAVVTAAVVSPRVRGMLRSGLVYGLAGVIRVGEGAASLVHDAVAEVGRTATGTVSDVREAVRGEPDLPPVPHKPRTKAAA